MILLSQLVAILFKMARYSWCRVLPWHLERSTGVSWSGLRLRVSVFVQQAPVYILGWPKSENVALLALTLATVSAAVTALAWRKALRLYEFSVTKCDYVGDCVIF